MFKKAPDRRADDKEQIQTILDHVDQQEAAEPRTNRRAHARHTYRCLAIGVRITQPGGGVIDVNVAGREISAGGMSFLYRGFLHAGTDVRLSLARRAGGHETVDSAVVWCRHIVGPHHLVGVKFRQRVFTRLFLDPGLSTEDDLPKIEPGSLRGAVLLIDDQELDRMLFEHHTAGLGLKVTSVGNAESALSAAKVTPFDIVICDLNLGESRGEELIAQLRKQGCACPIIALTAENSNPRIHAAEAAGAHMVVQKPYDPQGLLTIIAKMLSEGPSGSDPAIHSNLAGNPGADELIARCIAKVKSIAVELHGQIERGDFESVRALAQTLKGNGSGFGFKELTSAAKQVVDTLDASRAIEKSMDELRHLESICNRLAPGKAPVAK